MPGLLITNAAAGTAQKFPPARLLAELPAGTRLHEFQPGDDPAKLARDALGAGVEWIAVAGGDGSVEAVAGELVGTSTPLGVIPCGTFNNFARSLDLPADPLEAARVVGRNIVRRIDVGTVNGRPFFECVGVGLDAALFPVGEEIKSGGLTRWVEFFRRALTYPRQTFDLEIDRPLREALISKACTGGHPARRWRGLLRRNARAKIRLRALMITVSNGPYYGANFAVAPHARVDDERLTVTIFKRYSKLELWWHFFSIRAGRRVYAPRVVALAVERVRISGPGRLPVHSDGAPCEIWPVDLRVWPRALQVFCGDKTT